MTPKRWRVRSRVWVVVDASGAMAFAREDDVAMVVAVAAEVAMKVRLFM